MLTGINVGLYNEDYPLYRIILKVWDKCVGFLDTPTSMASTGINRWFKVFLDQLINESRRTGCSYGIY